MNAILCADEARCSDNETTTGRRPSLYEHTIQCLMWTDNETVIVYRQKQNQSRIDQEEPAMVGMAERQGLVDRSSSSTNAQTKQQLLSVI